MITVTPSMLRQFIRHNNLGCRVESSRHNYRSVHLVESRALLRTETKWVFYRDCSERRVLCASRPEPQSHDPSRVATPRSPGIWSDRSRNDRGVFKESRRPGSLCTATRWRTDSMAKMRWLMGCVKRWIDIPETAWRKQLLEIISTDEPPSPTLSI